MQDRNMAQTPATPATATAGSQQMVERERAQAFSAGLRTLLQRQEFYVPRTGTYLLPQLYERVRQVSGQIIHINTLRAYLRGESLPSDSKVRVLADALEVPRGVLLYCAGYLTPEDLPNYPGPQTTLATIEADMREVEALPLSPRTKAHILRDLQTSARILQLLAAEQAVSNYHTAPDEREHLIELLIELWDAEVPPPPAITTTEEARRATAAPAPANAAVPARPVPQPVRTR